MFLRDRVIGSLQKYNIAFHDDETTEALRAKLAEFYAQRTITRRLILPEDCARAICWLRGTEREDDGARHSGGRRVARGVSPLAGLGNSPEACDYRHGVELSAEDRGHPWAVLVFLLQFRLQRAHSRARSTRSTTLQVLVGTG